MIGGWVAVTGLLDGLGEGSAVKIGSIVGRSVGGGAEASTMAANALPVE